MTDTETGADTGTDTGTAMHEHEGMGWHEHEEGEEPHGHSPAERVRPPYVPDPDVQAFVTNVTISMAHGNDKGPYEIIEEITKALEVLGIRGIVVGVSAVELRGDGGLIAL